MRSQIQVLNPVPESELLCDCGFDGLHDHGECHSAIRCHKCGCSFRYKSLHAVYVLDGVEPTPVFVCQCGSSRYNIFSHFAQAAECYPNGCECQNNGDSCSYCTILLEGLGTCPDCGDDTGDGSTCAACAAALPENQDVN